MPSASSDLPHPGALAGEPARGPRARARAALESIRPYQWLKNALVLVPLAAAHRLGEPALLIPALLGMLAFSLCASGVYVLNDLWDETADRHHPHKWRRPIASGRLSHAWAIAIAVVLVLAALLTAALVGRALIAVIGAYFGLMVLYSLRLKSVVLLDAMILAGGYALRVVAGSLAVRIWPSPWLLMLCIFFFFSLALLKRYAELALLRARDGAAARARAYLSQDLEFILMLGVGCGIASVLVLALYTSSNPAPLLYHRSGFLWGNCVLLLYWVSHMWLAAHRGRMTDDPLVFALRDPVSEALLVLMALSAWAAL